MCETVVDVTAQKARRDENNEVPHADDLVLMSKTKVNIKERP